MAYRRASIAAGVTAVVVLVAACGASGTTLTVTSSPSSSVPAGPASESVPASVPKDSVLDLNSTKDMTGVVTTVPINESPYAAHFPDVCQLIPDSVIREVGLVSKRRAFSGTQLVTQGCVSRSSSSGEGPRYDVGIALYVNNIQELLGQEGNVIRGKDIPVAPKVRATVFQNTDTDIGVVAGQETCSAAWGTFFGGVIVSFTTLESYVADDCQRAVEISRKITPFMPKSPSEMRPAP